MDRAIVDDDFGGKLDKFCTQTEFCDKDGRVIGVFIPTKAQERKWYDWARGRYSEEELDCRCNEPGEKTTAEVLKSLHEP
jgi:hypothetical protein